MDALAKGLEQLGIATLLYNHPILAELFTHTVSPLTAGGFVRLMRRQCSLSDMPLDQRQAYKWFLEYLKARETCKLSVTRCMYIDK